MDKNTIILLVVAFYFALVAMLLFANWHRRRLVNWAKKEVLWVQREAEELSRMRKHLVQQFTWESTKGYHGNVFLNEAFEARRKEFNQRREQLLQVTEKAQKLLPW